MLYNKNWDKPEVKSDPFTLESLIVWLKKQPRRKTYDWADQPNCMMTQYLIAHGLEWDNGNYSKLRLAIGDDGQDDDIFIALNTPWTFGAALKRARKAQALR